MVVCVWNEFSFRKKRDKTSKYEKNIPDGITCNFSIAYSFNISSFFACFGSDLAFFILLFVAPRNRELNQETQASQLGKKERNNKTALLGELCELWKEEKNHFEMNVKELKSMTLELLFEAGLSRSRYIVLALRTKALN